MLTGLVSGETLSGLADTPNPSKGTGHSVPTLLGAGSHGFDHGVTRRKQPGESIWQQREDGWGGE